MSRSTMSPQMDLPGITKNSNSFILMCFTSVGQGDNLYKGLSLCTVTKMERNQRSLTR